MQLRPYQSAAVQAVADWAVQRPGEHPLLVIPTGGGKTAVMAGLVQTVLRGDPGARCLILAHRKELLEQSLATALRCGIADVGVYAANLGRKDRGAQLTVASVQSLRTDPYVICRGRPMDLVLVDEAHLAPKDDDTSFRRVLQAMHTANPRVCIVGLTATPYRLGTGLLHEGENRLFSGIAYEVTIPALLAEGFLAPVRSRATTQRLSVAGVAVRGDFVASDLAAKVDQTDITSAIVSETIARAEGRRSWLVFAVSVEHAEHLAAAFRAAGVTAAAVHGKLSDRERASLIAQHKDGTLTCAVTCELLTTGYDAPRIDLIVMARPTKSPALYYQMIGRAFRVAPGKTDALVLDFAGNVTRHGPVDTLSERITTPAPSAGGPAPAKECPGCMALLATAIRVCPDCGHEFPEPVVELAPVPVQAPVLSTEPDWRDVNGVSFSVNIPRDPSKRTTLRVDYLDGFRTVVSEWVCLEHDGYARAKAEAWWHERCLPEPVPTDVIEAHTLLDSLDPRPLTPDAVLIMPDGKYERIAAIRWGADMLEAQADRDAAIAERHALQAQPGALPRACWTCAHLAGSTCRAADGLAIPDEVMAEGCEAWTDADVGAEVVTMTRAAA